MAQEEAGMTDATTLEEYRTWYVGKYPDSAESLRVVDGVLEESTTYNSDSKWDWYVVGGRWDGELMLLDGTTCNGARISSIDWKAMERAAAAAAEVSVDKVLKAIEGLPRPQLFSAVVDRHPGDIDAARAEYAEQPAIKAIRATDVFTFEDVVRVFCLDQDDPRAAFIQKQVDAIPHCYAIVYKGEWYAQGEMGWFGMSNDTLDEGVWRKHVKQLLHDNPDEQVTVVDCHI
jgi:hypothetical protein